MREVLLSGEHPTLPAAELQALLDVHAPGARLHLEGPFARIQGDDAASDVALQGMALAHAWGESWGDAGDDDAGVAALAAVIRQRSSGAGSAAIVTERRGTEKASHVLAVERALGKALVEAGHRIDLKAPDVVVYGWLAAGRIRVGRRLGVTDRPAYEGRANAERAHFSPVSLHPRKAAALIHLARVKPGGSVYDPFCGTGTLVLEAALQGYKCTASDLDPFMVQGTLQTLTDTPPAPADVQAFVADIGETPELVGPVDAIVTDLPYGRASGTQGEGLATLYDRALASFAALLHPGGHAVVGCADPKALGDPMRHGFAVREHHSEVVHRSLTRHFLVLRRA